MIKDRQRANSLLLSCTIDDHGAHADRAEWLRGRGEEGDETGELGTHHRPDHLARKTGEGDPGRAARARGVRQVPVTVAHAALSARRRPESRASRLRSHDSADHVTGPGTRHPPPPGWRRASELQPLADLARAFDVTPLARLKGLNYAEETVFQMIMNIFIIFRTGKIWKILWTWTGYFQLDKT